MTHYHTRLADCSCPVNLYLCLTLPVAKVWVFLKPVNLLSKIDHDLQPDLWALNSQLLFSVPLFFRLLLSQFLPSHCPPNHYPSCVFGWSDGLSSSVFISLNSSSFPLENSKFGIPSPSLYPGCQTLLGWIALPRASVPSSVCGFPLHRSPVAVHQWFYLSLKSVRSSIPITNLSHLSQSGRPLTETLSSFFFVDNHAS